MAIGCGFKICKAPLPPQNTNKEIWTLGKIFTELCQILIVISQGGFPDKLTISGVPLGFWPGPPNLQAHGGYAILGRFYEFCFDLMIVLIV